MADLSKPKPFIKQDKNPSSVKPEQKSKEPTSKINKKGSQSGLPKEVANRMARRIALTTGLPTISGMGVFVASYLLVSMGIADVPPIITLIISGACFITGLIGLSYGILSSSWDKKPGTILGLENIRPNISRVRSAFSSANQSTD